MNVTLFGKGVFPEVIKDLEERLSYIIHVGPKCNHRCPYKRGAEGDVTPIPTEEKVDIGAMHPEQASGCQQHFLLQEELERPGQILPWSLQRECGPASFLNVASETDFRLLASKTMKK